MNLIDFCCGGGGLSLGMMMAGHTITAAFDVDPAAVECYRTNIGDHVRQVDLREIRADDLPDSDGFIGGVPCQPFSHSNANGTGPLDPRNMLPEFRRLVIERRPRMFVFENVPTLLTIHGRYLATELEQFVRAGYFVLPVILQASLYGVAQDRRRLIVFGSLNRWPIIPEPINTRRSAMSARQALAPVLGEPDTNGLPNYLRHLAHGPDKLINGSNRSMMANGSRKIQWRLLDRPSFTILANGNYRNKAWIDRKSYTLRAPQLAALQSFPPTWRWPEQYDLGKRLVGNAVPPLLAYALGRSI